MPAKLKAVSSHRRLIAFLLSPLTLSHVRRFAPIAVGAAVAYVLLLPAAAAWLRQPAPTPLPGPLTLDSESGRPDAYAPAERVHSKLLSHARPVDRAIRVRQRRRPATYRAQAVVLAPTPARAVATRPVEGDDDDEGDDAVHAFDGHGDDELGDD